MPIELQRGGLEQWNSKLLKYNLIIRSLRTPHVRMIGDCDKTWRRRSQGRGQTANRADDVEPHPFHRFAVSSSRLSDCNDDYPRARWNVSNVPLKVHLNFTIAALGVRWRSIARDCRHAQTIIGRGSSGRRIVTVWNNEIIMSSSKICKTAIRQMKTKSNWKSLLNWNWIKFVLAVSVDVWRLAIHIPYNIAIRGLHHLRVNKLWW